MVLAQLKVQVLSILVLLVLVLLPLVLDNFVLHEKPVVHVNFITSFVVVLGLELLVIVDLLLHEILDFDLLIASLLVEFSLLLVEMLTIEQ